MVCDKEQSSGAHQEGNSGVVRDDGLIRLNVGGTHFVTSRATITNCPNSMLASMFRGDFANVTDSAGFAFIDRDGSRFAHVLNFLRCGNLPCFEQQWRYEAILEEADFFALENLKELCTKRLEQMREAQETRSSMSCNITIAELVPNAAAASVAAASAGGPPYIPASWRGVGEFTLDEEF